MTHLSKLLGLTAVTAMAFAWLGGIQWRAALAQSTYTSTQITPEELRDAGLHLPSYIPDIREQMRYQDALPLHQELRVEWDSLPGQTAIARKEDVERLPLSPNFTLLERKQGLPGGAGKMWDNLSTDGLVIAGVTSQGEIRGLIVQGDPRLFFGERMGPAGPPERRDFVKPRVILDLGLPDDPQIQKIVFLRPLHPNPEKWELKIFGSIDLKTTPKAPPK